MLFKFGDGGTRVRVIAVSDDMPVIHPGNRIEDFRMHSCVVVAGKTSSRHAEINVAESALVEADAFVRPARRNERVQASAAGRMRPGLRVPILRLAYAPAYTLQSRIRREAAPESATQSPIRHLDLAVSALRGANSPAESFPLPGFHPQAAVAAAGLPPRLS